MESKENKYDVTPLGILNNAKVWYVLYRQNINLSTQHKIVAIYCLLISFEMHLKSYLVFLNKDKYSYDSELSGLGHEFKNIFAALDKEKPKLINHIGEIIKRYGLLSVDVNNLRYPKKGDGFLMQEDYLKPHNEFDELFDHISTEVHIGIIDKFYD